VTSARTASIQRYEIKGDVLEEYFLENGAAVGSPRIEISHAANITRNRGEGRYVVIKTFDDEVFRILAEMAADSKSGSCSAGTRDVESRN
jgi:hypothetical protein